MRRSFARLGVATAVCGLAAGCGGSPRVEHVTLSVSPKRSLIDQPLRVVARGLTSKRALRLTATWPSAAGREWTSSLRLRPDRRGTAVLSGVGGMRFLWSMHPGAHSQSDYPSLSPRWSRIGLAVVDNNHVLARATAWRRAGLPSIHPRKLTVARDGIDGHFFDPHTHGRRAAIVTFGGSEGGDSTTLTAGLLAAHGNPVLSIAYFAAPGLPKTLENVPLEYFARAVRWLAQQPDVDRRRIVVGGVSRGGEAALLVASTFPRLIHGAIALVPSDWVNPAWPSLRAAWTYRGRPVIRGTEIPVRRIDGPVLAAGSGADTEWGSADAVAKIRHELAAAHFAFPNQELVFPRAGHAIGFGIPYLPQSTDGGGSAPADAAARAVVWPRILALLGHM